MVDSLKQAPNDELLELFARGAHYGCSRSRCHPSASPFLYGLKNRTAIIDLEQTLIALARAEGFLRDLGRSGRRLLLVGTKPEAREAIVAASQKLSAPYVSLRWIGGILTNFSEIRKRLARFEELKQMSVSVSWDDYTKQERALFQKELEHLERSFASIVSLTELPAALLVVDSQAEKIAVAEARILHLPIIGISGPDCNLNLVDYPIVVNDTNIKTIEWFISRLVEAYLLGTKEKEQEKEKTVEAENIVKA